MEINDTNINEFLVGIAEIHYGAYSTSHFTSNFDSLMLKRYYTCLIENSDLSLVSVTDNEIDGFIVAGYNVGRGVAQFVKSYRLSVIRVFLSNPKFLAEKFLSFISKLKASNESTELSKFRLMSIAVNPKTQSKGVGSQMLLSFESILQMRGIKSYGLSVRKKNARAVGFYIRNDFSVQKETKDSIYFSKAVVHD
ncbi:MAG: N-acetyltransferase [Halopseudomonas sabulinigri]